MHLRVELAKLRHGAVSLSGHVLKYEKMNIWFQSAFDSPSFGGQSSPAQRTWPWRTPPGQRQLSLKEPSFLGLISFLVRGQLWRIRFRSTRFLWYTTLHLYSKHDLYFLLVKNIFVDFLANKSSLRFYWCQGARGQGQQFLYPGNNSDTGRH